jgi:uncharacterized protein (UPF0332 family)
MSNLINASLSQAKYNLEFYNCICAHYPSKFSDWKVIVLFYACLHYTKAFLLDYGFSADDIDSHDKTLRIIKFNEFDSKNVVNKDFANYYRDFYQSSRTVRYSGMKNESTFESDLLTDLEMAIQYTDYIRKYLTKRGIDCGIVMPPKAAPSKKTIAKK